MFFALSTYSSDGDSCVISSSDEHDVNITQKSNATSVKNILFFFIIKRDLLYDKLLVIEQKGREYLIVSYLCNEPQQK